MKIDFPLMLLALHLLGSCSDQVEETDLPAPEPLEDPSSRTVAREEEVFQEGASDFISDDRSLGEIMEDFGSSIDTYPTVDQQETIMKKNGRLYRRGLEDEPFTGSVVETFPDGSLALSTTFHQGKPHGFQKRNFPDGKSASEVLFDKGVLSGTRTKWWKNGRLREQEYWSDGKLKGRRLWDDEGRLVREEIFPED